MKNCGTISWVVCERGFRDALIPSVVSPIECPISPAPCVAFETGEKDLDLLVAYEIDLVPRLCQLATT